jgi:hypothetical protein
MKKLFGMMTAVSMLAGGTALAQDAQTPPAASAAPAAPAAPAANVAKPSAESIKAVWDFHLKGQGAGVVLADAKLCTEIAKEGDNKYECTAEIGPEGVAAGTTVLLWQAYLVPNGDSVEDIGVQVKQGDTVRETKDVKIKGTTMRTRTWTGIRAPKAGDWTIAVVRGTETLKTLKLKVTK